jgi:ferredoxin-NADP reductase
MRVSIAGIETLSGTIKKFTLRGDAPLPPAGAGAHIIVEIPGTQRVWKNAYSLVSAPGERTQYEIIVRRVAESRGGSAWLHDHAQLGQGLEIGLPQNFFVLPRTAKKFLLLSAGIGITPFLSYLRILNTPYEMHHCCKPEEAEVFGALLPAGATIHTSRNALNLSALLAAQKLDTHLAVCGPEPFMDAALSAAQHLGWGPARIHSESFGGATGGAPFTVHLARSGRTLAVAHDRTLLEALEEAGLNPPCLCRGGACGECELPVLAGVPEHHDHFLSDTKRADNSAIMTCVSRARTPELTLDF